MYVRMYYESMSLCILVCVCMCECVLFLFLFVDNIVCLCVTAHVEPVRAGVVGTQAQCMST